MEKYNFDEYNTMIRKHIHKLTNLDNYVVGDHAMLITIIPSPKMVLIFIHQIWLKYSISKPKKNIV